MIVRVIAFFSLLAAFWGGVGTIAAARFHDFRRDGHDIFALAYRAFGGRRALVLASIAIPSLVYVYCFQGA